MENVKDKVNVFIYKDKGLKVYLAYSSNYHDLLERNNSRMIISFGRAEGDQKKGNYVLPQGFNDYILDSGGFQFQTGVTTRSISVGSYSLFIEFALRENGDKLKGWMGLDVADWEISLKNYDELKKNGFPCIPVWKAFWPDEILEYLCSEYDYLAIGGIAFTAKKSTLRSTWERVFQKYPNKKFHLLGVGVRAGLVLRTFRPYSIDVSTWSAPARFGQHLVWDEKVGKIYQRELPPELRQKLRDDENYEREQVEQAIQALQKFETGLDNLHEPTQEQLDLEKKK